MIRVAVADDQQLVREAFALILDAQDDIEVVGTAQDGAEAVRLVRAEKPDVVLMDVRMPGMDGLAATKALMRSGVSTRVLVLTTYDADEYVVQALQAGALGFLLKDSPRAALLAAVRAVAQGDLLLDGAVGRRLVGQLAGGAEPTVSAVLARLTPREREVLAEVAQGNSNAEIAASLVISEATVKTHVAHLLDKLGARDRVQLAVLAHRAGLT